VRLVSRDEEGVVFLIGKRERAMMEALLARYPVVNTAARPVSHEESPQMDEAKALLQEALAERQAENRRQIQAFLAEGGRFEPNDLGFRFRIRAAEAEWLLQVFNDIRVGSWIKLGSPTEDIYSLPSLTVPNVELAWAMEVGNLFECALLEAIDPEATDPEG
jgi:hypothetical protein